MYAALNEQDLLWRVFGRCLASDPLNREIGDLNDGEGAGLAEQALHLRSI